MELDRVLRDIAFCALDCAGSGGGGKVADLAPFTNPTGAGDAGEPAEYMEPGLNANGRGVGSVEVYEGG